jgi:hypothetical protein
MKLKITTDKNQIKELKLLPGKLSDNARKRLGKVLLVSAINIAEGAKDEIQRGAPRTGILYRKASGRMHRASAPGEYPASDTGQLVNSIHAVKVSGLAVRVGSVAKHGKWLEEGTKYMRRRPWLSPEVTKELPNLRKQVLKSIGTGIKK